MLIYRVRSFTLYLFGRHNQLTRLHRACYDSGAFSQIVEGALFLPGEFGESKAPLSEGIFLFCAGRLFLLGSLYSLERVLRKRATGHRADQRRLDFGVYTVLRHKQLTNYPLACYDSGAFSETTEGALFLPNE